MKNKLFQICCYLTVWQPRPFLCNDGRGEPLSWWFYRPRRGKFQGDYKFGQNSCVERNKLGNLWADFFYWLSNKFK